MANLISSVQLSSVFLNTIDERSKLWDNMGETVCKESWDTHGEPIFDFKIGAQEFGQFDRWKP